MKYRGPSGRFERCEYFFFSILTTDQPFHIRSHCIQRPVSDAVGNVGKKQFSSMDISR